MTYTLMNEDMNFMPTGVLSSAYPKETDAVDASNTLLITNPVDMEVLQDIDVFNIQKNIALMGVGNDGTFGFDAQPYEWITFETIVSTGGNYRLNGITRGALNTPPMDHAAATRIWFMAYGGGVLNKSLGLDSTQHIKLTPHTGRGTLSTGDAQAFDITVALTRPMMRVPYPPAKIRIQDGSGTPWEWSTGPVNADHDLTMHYVPRNRIYQPNILNQDDDGVSQGTEGGTTRGAAGSTKGYLSSIWDSTGGLIRARNESRTSTSFTYTVADMVADGSYAENGIEMRIQSRRYDITNQATTAVTAYASMAQRRNGDGDGIERVGWGIGWGNGWGGVPNT